MRRPIQHRLDAFGSECACSKLAPSTASPIAPFNDHWRVTASVMIGTFIAYIDGMIVNIDLPKIMSSCGVDVLKIRWVAISYMLASAVMMPATGWLGQRLVAREALIGAFNDGFLIRGLVALATMTPTLFLTDFRARNRSLR